MGNVNIMPEKVSQSDRLKWGGGVSSYGRGTFQKRGFPRIITTLSQSSTTHCQLFKLCQRGDVHKWVKGTELKIRSEYVIVSF